MKAQLWLDGSHHGSWNMAMDWAMLEQASCTNSIILRLYTWQTPTISLGYFQRWEDLQAYPSLEGLDCVRRVTGGGAIVHDIEWTYSVAIPESMPQKGHSDKLYRQIHSSVAAWLDLSGFVTSMWDASPNYRPSTTESERSFLCFERRSDVDLVFGLRKVLGSAQRRTNQGLLQHGSLLLSASPHYPSLAGLVDDRFNVSPSNRLDIIRETNVAGSKCFRKDGFIAAVQKACGLGEKLEWEFFTPTKECLARATQIEEERFGNANWTQSKIR